MALACGRERTRRLATGVVWVVELGGKRRQGWPVVGLQ